MEHPARTTGRERTRPRAQSVMAGPTRSSVPHNGRGASAGTNDGTVGGLTSFRGCFRTSSQKYSHTVRGVESCQCFSMMTTLQQQGGPAQNRTPAVEIDENLKRRGATATLALQRCSACTRPRHRGDAHEPINGVVTLLCAARARMPCSLRQAAARHYIPVQSPTVTAPSPKRDILPCWQRGAHNATHATPPTQQRPYPCSRQSQCSDSRGSPPRRTPTSSV